MKNSFVIKGNVCQTKFDAVVMDDTALPHPQPLNLAERMERAVYLGLDTKDITAKFVAGTKII